MIKFIYCRCIGLYSEFCGDKIFFEPYVIFLLKLLHRLPFLSVEIST